MNQSLLEKTGKTGNGRSLHYGPVETELMAAERLLANRLQNPHPYLDELVRYGCMLGGKRLRPALLLCAAKAVGEVKPAHITLAAAIEMIHTATLVHDDVLDGAATRRHLATVNSRWDDEAAILLGDYLFTQAFSMVCDLESPFASRLVSHTTRKICEGELLQKGSRGDFALDEATYLRIIEAKTAELCACSAELGAHVAGGAPELTQSLARYARWLGIAFQIADDILDLIGDEEQMGKSLGTDLAKRKPTLPIIRLLQVNGGAERRALVETLAGSAPIDMARLHQALRDCGAISYARQQARSFAQRAHDELDVLPGTPAQRLLHEVADFAISRAI